MVVVIGTEMEKVGLEIRIQLEHLHDQRANVIWCCEIHIVDKVEALKRYKFSLAFENTNEEDYVTEKFFQSLVAGMF